MPIVVNDPDHFTDALFQSITIGVVVTDGKGCVTHINPIAVEMLGRSEAELLGKKFTQKVIGLDENGKRIMQANRPMMRALNRGENVSTRVRYRHADGHFIPVALSVSPVIIDGQRIGAIQMFRDVTLEDEIDRMKSDFISLASHQLRTPLSAIQTYAHLIMDGYLGGVNDEQKRSLGTILSAANRMNELVSTLLSITRVEGGNMTVSPRSIDVVALAEDVSKEHQLDAVEHDITLTLTAPHEPLFIQTDSLLFREVLSNIISNALKYTPPQGSVTMNIKKRTHDVVFTVRDTGLGIPKDAQAQVFTKFFRASNVVKRETNGTGLGLYLVKGLVDALGGKIWFESTENVGTTFHISLPKEWE